MSLKFQEGRLHRALRVEKGPLSVAGRSGPPGIRTFNGRVSVKRSTLIASAAVLLLTGAAQARDQIRIVGSSTVYPFTTAVAEQFGRSGGGKTPVVESTGTGGGFKLFCAGVGVAHPDLTNASRAIRKSEFDECAKNGVTEIVEIKVGIDGLTISQSKNGPAMKLSMEQVFLALAEEVPGADGKLVANPHKNW